MNKKTVSFLALFFVLMNPSARAEVQLWPNEILALGAYVTESWPLQIKRSIENLSSKTIAEMDDASLISYTSEAFTGYRSARIAEELENSRSALMFLEIPKSDPERMARDNAEAEKIKQKIAVYRASLRTSLDMASKTFRALNDDANKQSSIVMALKFFWQEKMRVERLWHKTTNVVGVGGQSSRGGAEAARWNDLGEELPADDDLRVVQMTNEMDALDSNIVRLLLKL